MELPIYLDNAATTAVAPEVLRAMLPFFSETYANPATIYTPGLAAREAVEAAREILARLLHALPEEIMFTSGGTESDNAALRGVLAADNRPRQHLLVSSVEHHAVLETARAMARDGIEVEYLPVDAEGRVSPADVAHRLRPQTRLVSVMHANNEVGTVSPVAEIGALCRARGVLFHTDAVQTFGHLPIDVRAMHIDLLSISAHKFCGPKGVGALYVRRGVPFEPFMLGGEQEGGRRAGTLNVPGIVGMAAAAQLAADQMESEACRLTELRDTFLEEVIHRVPGTVICGSRTDRLPGNIHICIPGIQGEAMLLALNEAGICASAGSACATGSTEVSHVLAAMGVDESTARGALRLTMGRGTQQQDLDYVLRALADAVQDLRRLKPKS